MYLAEDLDNFQTRTAPGSEHDLDNQGRRHENEKNWACETANLSCDVHF